MYSHYRLDDSAFDRCRPNAKTKIPEKLIREALFANDCALMAFKENDLPIIVYSFSEEFQLFGLAISLGKTECQGHHISIAWRREV